MSGYTRAALHEEAGIAPGQYLWDKLPTPEQMRTQLAHAARHSHTIHNVCLTAEERGWSGEDKYTAMAWFAALEAERYADDNAGHIMRSCTQSLAPRI